MGTRAERVKDLITYFRSAVLSVPVLLVCSAWMLGCGNTGKNADLLVSGQDRNSLSVSASTSGSDPMVQETAAEGKTDPGEEKNQMISETVVMEVYAGPDAAGGEEAESEAKVGERNEEETIQESEEKSFTPVDPGTYDHVTAYLQELGFVSTFFSETWDNWLYVIDDRHANLILIEDPEDYPYGNYLLFVAIPLSADKKVDWTDHENVTALALEAEKMEKDVLYELYSEEEIREVIGSYGR